MCLHPGGALRQRREAAGKLLAVQDAAVGGQSSAARQVCSRAFQGVPRQQTQRIITGRGTPPCGVRQSLCDSNRAGQVRPARLNSSAAQAVTAPPQPQLGHSCCKPPLGHPCCKPPLGHPCCKPPLGTPAAALIHSMHTAPPQPPLGPCCNPHPPIAHP